MDLCIVPHYEKDKYIINTDISFIKYLDFEAYVHKYYSKTGFELYTVDDDGYNYDVTDNTAAVVETVLFNIKHIFEDDVDIQDIADIIQSNFGEDISHAINVFYENGLYGECDFCQNELLCYLHRLYVFPEYRNCGIANYIFKNIQDILEYISGEMTGAILIYPKPQIPTNGIWYNAKDDVMLNKMISKIQQFNFVPVGKTGFYTKTF